MVETIRGRGSRAARRAALLACTVLLGSGVVFAQSADLPLRQGIAPAPSANAAERRARLLLGEPVGLIADSFLPGVRGLTDRGPRDDGSVRHARVRADNLFEATPMGAPPVTIGAGDVAGAIRGALSVNEGLQGSLHRAEAAAHELAQARGAMLPKVTFGGEIGTDDPTERWKNNRSGRVELALAMPLFASGANVNAVRAAQARRDVAELTVLAEGRREMLRAATAHLGVIAAESIVRALAENVRGMELTANAARALAKAGEAGMADVSLAEANLSAGRGELSAGKQALEKARIEYQSLTGRPPNGLRKPETDRLVPRDVEAVVANALARNPDAKAGWRNADAQRYAARAAYGAIGPSLSLTGTVGRDYVRDERQDGWEDWDAAVGVRLSVPLVDAEALPRVRGARALARAAEWDARDTAREIERRVRVAHAAHQAAVERQSHAEARVGAVKRALGATRAEYAAGLIAVTDVNRAQVDLARARIDLANLERDRHRAAFTLALAAEIPIPSL